MIKQINEFIDWPALVELLSPEDRTQHEELKSECRFLMASSSPNHEEITRRIRTGQEFLITNPELDPASARELWRSFLSSSYPSNDKTEESKKNETPENRLAMMYAKRREGRTHGENL